MIVTLLLLAACETPVPKPPGSTPAVETGEGLFAAGCPIAGQATARTLTEIAERPWGDDALAAPGDVLLLNERAAFVIQDPTAPRTYYHYGGLPIDAVAVEGCEQAGPEILGELGLVIGQLDLVDFDASSLHQVRGESMRVVSDGSDGGPAVAEVDATDDRFWLIELTLMRYVFEDGGRKELGDLYGLDLTLRYTLAPGDAALQLDVLLGGEPITDGFLLGALLFPSDHTEEHAWYADELSVGGLGLDVGMPWVGDGSGTGSTALSMPGATMALTTIAGVTAVVDAGQVGEPLEVGDEGHFLLAVGPTDAAGAAAALEPHLDDPIPGFATSWHDLSGMVTDPAGDAASGVTVEVATPDDEGNWRVLTTFVTGADGSFSGRVLAVDGALRLQAGGDGREDGDALEIAADDGAGVDLGVGFAGAVSVEAFDGDGDLRPVRVELEREDGLVVTGYANEGFSQVAAPPGTYTVYLTAGYEYAPVTTTVTVPDGGIGFVDAVLEHVVDTTGWASYDSHVHAGPSADADTLPAERMRSAAGSGLDLVISTDHEAIIDLSGAVTEAELGEQLAYALGSEITASLPEHTNAWPFPEVYTDRGDPVVWYGMGFPGIYAAERERGAMVVQLNHSRVNGECGILCLLDWDRVTDPPATDDPEALGLPAGEPIWSWDFDAFELLNGLRSPYYTDDTRRSGALYDWLAFHNLGYPVTPVGVTDVHGDGTPGTPRTYVAVADDTVISGEEMAQATLDGAAQVSAGAFARVTVDGAGPGETVSVDDGEATLAIQVQALPEIDVTVVDVLVDCDAAYTLDATDPYGVVKLDTTLVLPVEGDHYVVVIARGVDPMPRGIEDYDATQVPRVLTAPVFIDGDGDGVWTAPGPKSCDWRPD